MHCPAACGGELNPKRLMKKRFLGNTGLAVSEVGFGAWAIGGIGYGEVSECQAYNCLETYIEAGGNYIDTARAYDESEKYIGRILTKYSQNDDLIISTKTTKGFSAESIKDIRKELDCSLRMLKRDYVDVYFLHNPPEDSEVIKRVLDQMQELKFQGKIRTVGASIKSSKVDDNTVNLCRQYILTGKVDVIQVIYSILRQKNASVFKQAYEHGVGIVVRSVLESGFLTGKYNIGHTFNDQRNRWSREKLDFILGMVADIKFNSKTQEIMTLGQAAIRFVLDNKYISTAIIGAKNKEQVMENILAANISPINKKLALKLKGKFTHIDNLFNP